jgi:hypothetical protein
VPETASGPLLEVYAAGGRGGGRPSGRQRRNHKAELTNRGSDSPRSDRGTSRFAGGERASTAWEASAGALSAGWAPSTVPSTHPAACRLGRFVVMSAGPGVLPTPGVARSEGALALNLSVPYARPRRHPGARAAVAARPVVEPDYWLRPDPVFVGHECQEWCRAETRELGEGRVPTMPAARPSSNDADYTGP